MDLLLLAKPGVHLYSLLHNSDTAWHAIRFYDHVNLGYGVLISVSGSVAALTLASDVRYYIRRYVSYHLFRTEHTVQMYATPALVTSRYLHRADSFHDGWNYRLILTVTDSIEQPFICTRYEEESRWKSKYEHESPIQEEYKILCTKEEWEEGAIITKL
ncbi:MAG: hypothetical protein LBV40_01640 [Methanomicrobiales archaeon]|jgi:hypothetical protein|nr:hypothetical protein [Methanomicrobiales archaeon]